MLVLSEYNTHGSEDLEEVHNSEKQETERTFCNISKNLLVLGKVNVLSLVYDS